MKYLKLVLIVLAVGFAVVVLGILFKKFIGFGPEDFSFKIETDRPTRDFPVHENIVVSVFWVGEQADDSNGFISNEASAWDGNWEKHYGGVDDPDNRDGFLPAGFTPKENPFYFALPYNDFDSKGKRKSEAADVVYWSKEKDWGERESMCKNRWIRITKNNSSAYAQWEDVGPFGEEDSDYVFGNTEPGNKRKSEAGLDVSPAVKDYLGLSDIDKADWQFVRDEDVPDGPWKQIVTTRNGD